MTVVRAEGSCRAHRKHTTAPLTVATRADPSGGPTLLARGAAPTVRPSALFVDAASEG